MYKIVTLLKSSISKNCWNAQKKRNILGSEKKVLREATIKDRQAIAELVYVILTDMQLPFLKDKTKEQIVNLLAETITDPTYRYGYKRGIVEDIEGTVAGIAFGYRSFDEEVIDRPFSKTLQAHGLLNERLFTDPECFPDEWYLDTICVAEDFRGRGIGSKLLEGINLQAKTTGAHKIGLCVDHQNPKAQRLYERKGFKVVGEQVLSGHNYHHMQKVIA